MHWLNKHARLRHKLSPYIDDQLTASETAALEAHLASCDACRRRLDELRATVSALHEQPQAEAPRSFAITPGRLERKSAAAARPLPALGLGMRLAGAVVVPVKLRPRPRPSSRYLRLLRAPNHPMLPRSAETPPVVLQFRLLLRHQRTQPRAQLLTTTVAASQLYA